MPRWTFKCESCDFEADIAFKSLAEACQSRQWCPECHHSLKRMPSAPRAVIIKGYNAANGYSSK